MMGSHDYVGFVRNGRPQGTPLRDILRQVGATLVVALVADHFKGVGLLVSQTGGLHPTRTERDTRTWMNSLSTDYLIAVLTKPEPR